MHNRLKKEEGGEEEPQMTQICADIIKEGGHSCPPRREAGPPLIKNRGLENPLSVSSPTFLFPLSSFLSARSAAGASYPFPSNQPIIMNNWIGPFCLPHHPGRNLRRFYNRSESKN